MKNLFTLLIAIACILHSFAQNAPVIQWQKSLGGTEFDQGQKVYLLPNGNILAAGYTSSSDGDVSYLHGFFSDIWLCMLDSSGNLTWEHSYGGTNGEQSAHLLYTFYGKNFLVAETFSNDGDVDFNHGLGDIWMVELDSSYNIVSQKSYGGSKSDNPGDVIETSTHSIVIAGSSLSTNGDVTSHYGPPGVADVWVLWCDSAGNLLHEKNYGGYQDDYGNSIIETTDGGFLITGTTWSDTLDVSGNHGDSDAWILKIDSAGTIEWQRCLGGSEADAGKEAIETPDGNYIILCNTQSDDGDVSGFHGYNDSWLVKLDASGNILWQKCYGGSEAEWGYSLIADKDRTWCLGSTESSDGDVSGLHGDNDVWLFEVDSAGTLLMQHCYGGSGGDRGSNIKSAGAGGWVMIGNSWCDDGDVSGHHGDGTKADYWVVKLDESLPTETSNGNVHHESCSVFPNPVSSSAVIEFSLSNSSEVIIELLDLQGRKIKTIAERNFEAGDHRLVIDKVSEALNAGVYLLELKTDSEITTQKLLIL